MTEYRLLALDLDDTLLTKNKRISEENKKWIQRAEEAGVVVMFATGRGRQKVENLLEELDLKGPMVLVNGAEVWADSDQLLDRYFIPKDDIRYLHGIATRHLAKFWGYSVDSLTKMADWSEDMFETQWLKFGIRKDDLPVIEQIREEARRHLPNIEITQSATVNMEASLKGVSKASGVREVCEHFGFEMNEVMAMGDNLNDYQLIKSAGLGIAMDNADSKLKDVADVITDHHEKNGVAKAIQRYLFQVDKKESISD